MAWRWAGGHTKLVLEMDTGPSEEAFLAYGFEKIASTGVIVVAGGGGFIGGHLIARLRTLGFNNLRAVDVKPVQEWHQVFPDVDNQVLDLRGLEACRRALKGSRTVFNFAADMGGMGFIENNKALCMLSVLINTHLLQSAQEVGVQRYFFASSACVYAASKQHETANPGLREEDAYPAEPEDGYGWEKLFSERMCRHFEEDFGLQTRIARFHNVYGPHGTYEGGREKAPAAICRKVATSLRTGDPGIEIWGDGEQTRSFLYIDDAIDGLLTLMGSDVSEPLNIGSEEMVSINGLVDIVENIAGATLVRHYNLNAPRGVRGRNSDNNLVRARLGWEPRIRLAEGLRETYRWIAEAIARPHDGPAQTGGTPDVLQVKSA